MLFNLKVVHTANDIRFVWKVYRRILHDILRVHFTAFERSTVMDATYECTLLMIDAQASENLSYLTLQHGHR